MNELTIVLEQQYNYFTRILTERSKKPEIFNQSLKHSLFPEEDSAYIVFYHGISSLFDASKKLMDSFKLKSDFKNHLEEYDLKEMDLFSQLKKSFQMSIDIFTYVYSQIDLKSLEDEIETTIENRRMKVSDWLSINIFHTVGHIAQAMRLQSLYIRHR